MFEKVLYPTDFSDIAQTALKTVIELRGAGTKHVVLVRVLNDRYIEYIQKGIVFAGKDVGAFLVNVCATLKDEALQKLKPIESALVESGFTVTVRVECGSPHLKILDIAKSENVSAIILGSHGRSNISSALLGSVSDHVIRHAACTVVVVKRD